MFQINCIIPLKEFLFKNKKFLYQKYLKLTDQIFKNVHAQARGRINIKNCEVFIVYFN